MALTSLGFKLSVKIMDNGGNTTTRSWMMQSADHAAAVIDAGQVLTRLAAVSNGAIVSYEMSEVFAEDALTIPADASSQIEANMLLIGRDETNPLKKHSIRVPSPDPGVFLTGSGDGANIVDLNDAAVIAWYGCFTTNGELFISDGDICLDEGQGGLLSGRRVTHRSRRG